MLVDDFEPGTYDHVAPPPLQFQVAIDSQITITPSVLTFCVTPIENACRVTVTHDGWPSELEGLAGPRAWEERLTRLSAVAQRMQNEETH